MIANDDLDRFSEHLPAHVLDGHPRSIDRGFAPKICIGTRLIVKNSNADDAA
jgi:hypothetical protein